MSLCIFGGCPAKEAARGYCPKHYVAAKRQGLPLRPHKYERHNASYTPEYYAWENMIARCNYKSYKNYSDYGGRGIKVCDRWRNSFNNFYEDMGKRPSSKHSLDRKNTNGDYSPDNCRWATSTEQLINRRIAHNLTYNGKTQIVSEWAKELGISQFTLRARIRYGWSVERILGTPVSK